MDRDNKCHSLEPGSFPWDELAALRQENAHLRECMKVAGLQAFMRDKKPEEVAEHLKRVAVSWIKFEGGVREVLEDYMPIAMTHAHVSGWWKRIRTLLAEKETNEPRTQEKEKERNEK